MSGLSHDSDSLNGFLLTALLHYLIENNKINKETKDPYMIFKTVLLFLQKWPQEGLFFESKVGLSEELKEILFSCYQVVFLDHSGVLNLAGRMTKDSLLKIQFCAETSLQKLDHPLFTNGFEEVFLLSRDKFLDYDLIVRIRDLPEIANAYDLTSFKHALLRLLRAGLKERVYSFHLILQDQTFQLYDPSSKIEEKSEFSIGLRLHPFNSKSLVEYGPSYSDKEACAEFQAMWKDLAEVRRFKDGRILYAVVWEDIHPDKVILTMVDFLLREHLHLSCEFLLDQLDPFLLTPKDKSQDSTSYVFSTWYALEKVKSISGLPLTIVQALPVSSVFRRIGPIFQGSSHFDILLEFEASSKWPENGVAIQKLKTALYLYLKKALNQEFAIESVACQEFLQVSLGGLFFRLCIALPSHLSHYQSTFLFSF